MEVRRPIVAGQFYPADSNSCTAELQDCLEAHKIGLTLPKQIVAGIVPHAGWTFSGPLAGLVFAAIKHQHPVVDTFIIFGAAHSYLRGLPAVWSEGAWQSPLGKIKIDEDLAMAVIGTKTVVSNKAAHLSEHSIETQTPFIQHLFPKAKILPIVVPPSDNAIALGAALGDIITACDKKVVCIGSTDLTHYGPRYGFIPMGIGSEAIKWASQINDREFIDAVLELDEYRLLDSAAENYNACGAGAVAATVVTAKKLGKKKGLLLGQTTSSEIMLRKMGTPCEDSVGYAAIIF